MKGMQKIKRGSGFRGVVSYALDNGNGDLPGQIIGGNMSGTSVKALSKEFGAIRKVRPDVKKPVWHNSLRLPEGEKLSEEKWVEIADDYMKRMGFGDTHPRVYVLHDDAKGQHVHVIASRISLDGRLYLGKNENLTSTQHIQALERDYKLTLTKGPSIVDGRIVMPDQTRPKAGEVGQFERTGEASVRFSLIALIDAAMADQPTATAFVERLTGAGVEVRANFSKNTLNGFSFSFQEVPFKGSQLGKQYTGKALFQRGLSYEQDRDHAALRQLGAAAGSTAEHLGSAEVAWQSEPDRDRKNGENSSRVGRELRGAHGPRAGDRERSADASDAAGAGRLIRAGEVGYEGRSATAEVSHGVGQSHRGIGIDPESLDRAKAKESQIMAAPDNRDARHDHSSAQHDAGDGIATGVEFSAVGPIETGDRVTDELVRALHQGRVKSERDALARQKKRHTEDMANAKKREAELRKPFSLKLSKFADLGTDWSWRADAVRSHIKAVRALKFEVICVTSRSGDKPLKKTFAAADFQAPALLESLTQRSATGYEIKIRPDPSIGAIFVKNLTVDDVAKLNVAGLAPAAVIRTGTFFEACVVTGIELTGLERRMLMRRIYELTGVKQGLGEAGYLAGFFKTGTLLELSTSSGQIAPSARELVVEVRSEIAEAQSAKRLRLAIEKVLKAAPVQYEEMGGIERLPRKWFRSVCHEARAEATFFGGTYSDEQVRLGVLEAMARSGVQPSTAMEAACAESDGVERSWYRAAEETALAFARVDLETGGTGFQNTDLVADPGQRYPQLMEHAKRRAKAEREKLIVEISHETSERNDSRDDAMDRLRERALAPYFKGGVPIPRAERYGPSYGD